MASIISASTTSGTALNMSADTTGVLQLATGATPTTAVTIDTSQNVGIGTTSPTTTLTVAHSNGGAVDVRGVSSDGARIRFYNNAATSSQFQIGQGFASGSDNVGYLYNFANAALVFGTNNTERMRINSSGDVGIGITTQDTRLVVSANIGTAVQRIFNLVGTNTYQMSFHNSTQECGTITTGNNTVGYNSNSDYRLKDNVIPMTGALDKIAKLKPVTYTWKASETNGQGFIAHELQEHFPDAVSGEKDAVNEDGKPVYQGVDTSFLVATLTAAIQEQQTIINDLKARITALEGAA
jgi:hypothetical protein